MQGVNRGILEKAELIVNGGVVDNFYVAGEVDPSVTGKQNDSYIELNGGIIKRFYPGNSDLVEYKNINGTIMECVVEKGDVSMLTKVEKHPGFVRNDEFAEHVQSVNEQFATIQAEAEQAHANLNSVIENESKRIQQYVDEEISTHDYATISSIEIDNMINQY